MENNNLEEFNMDKFNELTAKIKAGSPVHKINFTLDSPNAVVGMYLISMDDNKSYIDKAADYTDITDDTLLVFESRHVIECCQIIYGALNVINGINMLKYSYKYIINNIIKALLTKPSYFDELIINMKDIAQNSIININTNNRSKAYNNFLYIITNIWFVPYGKIDEMVNNAIEEFKNHIKDGEKNE